MTSRAARGIAAAFAVLVCAAPTWAAELTDVRVGRHPTFTRVVFELDAPAGYRIERGTAEDGTFEIRVTLEAGARPRSLESRSEMVERVAVQDGRERALAHIRLKDKPSRVKELILADPPRIVFDLVFPEVKLAEIARREQAAKARAALAAKKPEPAKPIEAAAKPEPAKPMAAAAKPEAPKPTEAAAKPEPVKPTAAAPKPEPAKTTAVAPEPAKTAAPAVVAKPEPAPKPAPKPEVKAEAKAELPPGPEIATRIPPKPEAKPAAEPQAKLPSEPKAERMPGLRIEAKRPEPKPEIEAKAAPEPKAEAKPTPVAGAELPAEPDAKAEIEAMLAKPETRPEAKPGAEVPPVVAIAPGAATPVEALEKPGAGPETAVEGPAKPTAPDAAEPIRPPAPAPRQEAKAPAQPARSPAAGIDWMTWGGAAAGVVAVLLVFAVWRRRRALPNDIDVTALAEEVGGEAEGGFAIGEESIEESGGWQQPERPRPTLPSFGSAPAAPPAAGPGLFDDEDFEKETEMDTSSPKMPTSRGAEASTQFAAGGADIARLVRDLERRVAQLEARLDEATEARERLERQVATQAEELRVQRVAIARTQRALRGMNRSDEEQATEPALREPK